ncbi:hypothetical protein V6N11_019710 [Hibiscus sabdariffa]|uniref:Uncharacterized protein n=1 Tax=Hibiscus sabdariffa TaxID=183260 RepID=A0ABR2NLU7_9ROSI
MSPFLALGSTSVEIVPLISAHSYKSVGCLNPIYDYYSKSVKIAPLISARSYKSVGCLNPNEKCHSKGGDAYALLWTDLQACIEIPPLNMHSLLQECRDSSIISSFNRRNEP